MFSWQLDVGTSRAKGALTGALFVCYNGKQRASRRASNMSEVMEWVVVVTGPHGRFDSVLNLDMDDPDPFVGQLFQSETEALQAIRLARRQNTEEGESWMYDYQIIPVVSAGPGVLETSDVGEAAAADRLL
jgi:hypothetical protein